MKTLKFSEPLPKLILEGKKNISWRINDEKGITVGDKISLCHNSGEKFAEAIVIWIKETSFGGLTEEDIIGHEEFSSEEEMYQMYFKYYGFEVKPETKLKVIKFKLKN